MRSRGMKGVDWAAHEDPSAMQSATLSPILLLRRSFELVGPIYWPLLILTSSSHIAFFVVGLTSPSLGMILSLLLLAYVLVGAPILTGAAFWLVDQHLKQRTPLLGNSLDQAFSKAVPLIFGSLLVNLISSLGMQLFVFPGIYCRVRLAFTLCAIALEDKGATEGLGYSWNLVRGRWWGVFWAFLVVVLIFGISILLLPFVVAILGATLAAVVTGGNTDIIGLALLVWAPVVALLAVVVGFAAFTAVTPIFNVYTVLLFRSLQQLKGQAA
ncbi:glycerophosphoryl diester phosphodiesterase membrane domain-containing protein [Synechococcus sp. R70.1]|uniref:glycerophosphoryl diester phosphodiesterase membrane domain-containing protein n=1 Tax=Synechococcus sp. R70.1 TaxID=2964531 RepID=UPI0039C2A0BE